MINSLVFGTVLPSETESTDTMTTSDDNDGFFHTLRSRFKQFAAYVRGKVRKIIMYMKKAFKTLASQPSNNSNTDT